MNSFIKNKAESNLAISRELRESATQVPRSIQPVMMAAAASLEFANGYIAGFMSKAETGNTENFFQTLSEEENEILSSALLEYRSHLGKILDSYYRAEKFTDELRERAARTVSSIDKLNEWIAELDEGRKR